jgi:hypothetical protein
MTSTSTVMVGEGYSITAGVSIEMMRSMVGGAPPNLVAQELAEERVPTRIGLGWSADFYRQGMFHMICSSFFGK